ncbi:hypothetical protein FOMPIDRAFT_1111153, partial [Fomitopsis schrenkii]
SEQRPPKHDDEVWFKDGTIILIITSVAFRVYEGILCRESRVFRRRYGLNLLPDNVRKIDGCPATSLFHPAEDFRVLLRACSRHGSTLSKPNLPASIPI